MKKLLAIILAVIMVLSLAACGGGGAEPTKKPVTYPKHMGKLAEHPTCVLYATPEGEHAFNAFSDEGKEICYQAMIDFILK